MAFRSRTRPGRAILRVALAMGEDFDPELFGVISDASRDPDPQVRNAAAWSTVHLECAQSVAMLSDMAQNDPDEAVRNSAAEMLTEFQRGNQEQAAKKTIDTETSLRRHRDATG